MCIIDRSPLAAADVVEGTRLSLHPACSLLKQQAWNARNPSATVPLLVINNCHRISTEYTNQIMFHFCGVLIFITYNSNKKIIKTFDHQKLNVFVDVKERQIFEVFHSYHTHTTILNSAEYLPYIPYLLVI